jgi:hypothetical protein
VLSAIHDLHFRYAALGRLTRSTLLRRSLLVVAVGAALGAGSTAVHAASIPYGTVLISGAQWAGADAALGDLNVYSNGTQTTDQAGTFGLKYECTELAQRWAHYKFGEPATWPISNTADMWTAGPALPVPLFQNPNGGARPPQYGDILVFAATATNPTGHVGVVSSVTATTVTIVQQNFTVNGTPTGQWTQAMTGTSVASLGGDPVLGWLRPGSPAPPGPAQAPHNVGAPQVAVTPDGSTQLVFWKDSASNQLTEAWYTGAWNGPMAFPQLGALTSAPGVAVTKDGTTQLVFWDGPGGHLFEAWYTGVWNGPLDITTTYFGGHGILASAPSVTTTNDGTQLVFWRGTDGRLAEAWYSNGWHGPTEPALGSLASAPSSTISADGSTQLVFFQATDNHLTEDWFAGGAWHGPMERGATSSSPSVAVTPDGSTQLVFYRGPGGHLFEDWYTGAWNGPVDFTTTAFGGVGPLTSPPSATVTVDGSTQLVFWQGAGSTLWEAWYAGGHWNGPRNWSG